MNKEFNYLIIGLYDGYYYTSVCENGTTFEIPPKNLYNLPYDYEDLTREEFIIKNQDLFSNYNFIVVVADGHIDIIKECINNETETNNGI